MRHVEGVVAAYEREMALRRSLALELAGGREGEIPASGSNAARLCLSAWVLQPYVDLDRLELLLTAVAAEGDPQNLVRSPRSR